MGRIVTFGDLPYRETAAGVKRAPITGPEMKEMSAEAIKLGSGATLTESAPAGSDLYLFTLNGGVVVNGQGVGQESFVTVQEGTAVTVANPDGAEATLIGVLAPPARSGKALAGFSDGVKVAARATTKAHDVPEELKKRIYFVGKDAVRSERAHAMIVVYEKNTVTGLHMHPNAESMFVFLSGKTRFTVNGQDVVVGPGQATYFPTSDRHGLRVAEGDEVSFLEFHVPAAYGTVRG
jgi:mannose-6-phosphate isomerase-like protein (cupin superfamily)